MTSLGRLGVCKLGFIVQGIFSIIFGFASLILHPQFPKALLSISSQGYGLGSSPYGLKKLEKNVIGGLSFFVFVLSPWMPNCLPWAGTSIPALTFSRILEITGIGDAVNTIIVCAVQGVAFVISMRILFWSLARVKLRMIKPIK